MKIFLKILLLFYFVAAASSVKLEEIKKTGHTTLLKGMNFLMDQFENHLAITLNLLSIQDDDDGNELRNILYESFMQNPRFRVRQGMMEVIEQVAVAPRRNSIICVGSYKHFLIFYSRISPIAFEYSGYFIIVIVQATFEDLQKIFDNLWKISIYNINVVYKEHGNRMSIYSFFPFRSPTDCSNTTPVVILELFRNGTLVRHKHKIFPNKMKNLEQCPIRVSTPRLLAPYISEYIDKNGHKKLRGRDFEILKVLSQNLNFHMNITLFNDIGVMFSNGTATGIMKALLDDQADFAIGDFWLRTHRLNFLDASKPYSAEKLVFMIFSGKEMASLEKLLHPFHICTWFFLVISFAIGYLVIFITKLLPANIQNFIFGRNVKYPYLNMWISLCGSVQNQLPQRNFSRFILMSFLLFSLVIRSAYQAKMFKMMQLSMKYPEPKTIQDMIDLDYKFIVHSVYNELIIENHNLLVLL